MEKRVHKHGNWVGFLLTPVAFSIIFCFIFYVVFSPVVLPLLDVFNLFVGNNKQQEVTPPSMFSSLAQSFERQNNEIPLSTFVFPDSGVHYGEIEIGGTNIKADLFWNDSPKELNAGVGTYSGAWLPGFGRTVMLAGHTMTFFKGLGDAKIGDIITIDTYYGKYTYSITKTAIMHHQDASAYDFTREDENLVLYTCYPFISVGLTPTRYFVYANYESGPQVNKEK